MINSSISVGPDRGVIKWILIEKNEDLGLIITKTKAIRLPCMFTLSILLP